MRMVPGEVTSLPTGYTAEGPGETELETEVLWMPSRGVDLQVR